MAPDPILNANKLPTPRATFDYKRPPLDAATRLVLANTRIECLQTEVAELRRELADYRARWASLLAQVGPVDEGRARRCGNCLTPLRWFSIGAESRYSACPNEDCSVYCVAVEVE